MTDMREELAKIIAFSGRFAADISENADDFWMHTSNDRQSLYLKQADAIIAALPELVKPLEWVGPLAGIWEAGPRFHGDCAAYKIIWNLGRNETYTCYFGLVRLGVSQNLDAAKAAANTHHRAQIMAAFGLPEQEGSE